MEEREYGDPQPPWPELAKQHVRTLAQALDDQVLPDDEKTDVFENQRHLAIAHVVCSMPDSDYRTLVESTGAFLYLVPHYDSLGRFEAFAVTGDEKTGITNEYLPCCHILWLSPRLDRVIWDVAVAVVAFELARIVLRRPGFPCRKGYDPRRAEVIAWERARSWGFETQLEKLTSLR